MLNDVADAAGPIVGASRLAVNDTATTTDYPNLSRRSDSVNRFQQVSTYFEKDRSGPPNLVPAPSFEAQPSRCRRAPRAAPTTRRVYGAQRLRFVQPAELRRDELFAVVLEYAQIPPGWSRTLTGPEKKEYRRAIWRASRKPLTAAVHLRADPSMAAEIANNIAHVWSRHSHLPIQQKMRATKAPRSAQAQLGA